MLRWSLTKATKLLLFVEYLRMMTGLDDDNNHRDLFNEKFPPRTCEDKKKLDNFCMTLFH